MAGLIDADGGLDFGTGLAWLTGGIGQAGLVITTSTSEAALFLAEYGPYGMVMDFDDASIAIANAGGSLNYQSQGEVSNGALVGPGAKITYSAPSAKLTEQEDGVLRFNAHNLYLNNGSPANQSITVLSGASYEIKITGSVSITLSGAATGTVTAGTTAFTAATGTLTCGSTSGSGKVYVRRTPCNQLDIDTAGDAAYDLPYVWSGGVLQSEMIEPAATNLQFNSLLTNSTQTAVTRTLNAAVAPDGTSTATEYVETATTGAHFAQGGSFAVTSGTTYTGSAYFKSKGRRYVNLAENTATFGAGNYVCFDLQNGVVVSQSGLTGTITALPNSWFRCTYTGTAASTSAQVFVVLSNGTASRAPVYAGDGVSGVFVWGVQFETGTVATSPIITYGAAVTRVADNQSEALTDIPFISSAGTWVIKYRTRSTALGCAFSLSASAGSDANLMVFYGQNGAGSCNLVSYDGSGVLQVNITQSVNGAGQWNTVAIGVEGNNFAVSANGQAVVTDTSATVPVPTTLRIGSNRASNQHLNGEVELLAYFPERKSNATLQELSAL